MVQLSHAQYERLERAVTNGRRIAVYRRGTEFVVIPESLEYSLGRERIRARHPTTGEEVILYIDEIDGFEVIA